MAITSEIIGKLGGGAGVEETPISGTAKGNGTSALMTTITVPAGETWLVAVIGTVTTLASTLQGCPYITIGDKKAAFGSEGGVSALVTGAAEIRLRRNYNLGSDSFTGHVYTVKM